MKTILLLLCLGPFILQAQEGTGKIGYADVNYIYSKLPASKQIDAELKSLQSQLQNQLKIKSDELQGKYPYHTSREKSMTPAELQQARKELQALQESLQKLEREAQTKFQQKHKALMEPVTTSIQKAIGDVAKERQYIFILNAGTGTQDLILHAADKVDVSDLILEKMGVSSRENFPTTAEAP